MSSVSSSSFSLKGSVKYDDKEAFSAGFSTLKRKIITAVIAEYPEVGNLLRDGQIFDLPTYPVRLDVPQDDDMNVFQTLKYKQLIESTFREEMDIYSNYAQVTQLLNGFLDKPFAERLHSLSATALNAFTVGNPMLYWVEICKLAEGDLSTSIFTKYTTLLRSVSDIFTSTSGSNTIEEGEHITTTMRKFCKLGRKLLKDDALMDKFGAYAYLSNLGSEYSKAKETLSIHALTDSGIASSFPKDISEMRNLAEGMRVSQAELKANLAKTGSLPSKLAPCTKCHPLSRARTNHPTSEHRGRVWDPQNSDFKEEVIDERSQDTRDKKRNKSSKERKAWKDKLQQKQGSVGAKGEQFHGLHTTIRTGSLNPGDLSMPQISGSVKQRTTVGQMKPLSLDTGTQALVEANRAWLADTKYQTVSLSTVAGPVDLNVVGEHKILGGKAAYCESAAVGLANFSHLEVNYDIKGITTSCKEMDRKTGRPIKKVESFVFQRRDRKNYPEPEVSTELTFRVQKEGDCKSLFLLESSSHYVSNGVRKRGVESESASSGSETEPSDADEGGSDFSLSDEEGENLEE
jgi:hypothetical protein